MANKKTSANANKKASNSAVKKTASVKKKTAAKPVQKSSKRKVVKKKQSYSFVKSGIWTLLLAVFLGIFTYIPTTAPVPVFIKTSMLGFFAKTAYLVPAALFAIGVYVFKVKRTNKLILKIKTVINITHVVRKKPSIYI